MYYELRKRRRFCCQAEIVFIRTGKFRDIKEPTVWKIILYLENLFALFISSKDRFRRFSSLSVENVYDRYNNSVIKHDN